MLSQKEREQEKFRRDTYDIALNVGARSVEGDVLGNYGIHKHNYERWDVTYIPTGQLIGTFHTRTGARIVARFWHVEAGDQYPADMAIAVQLYILQFRGPRFDSAGVPSGYDQQGRLIEETA